MKQTYNPNWQREETVEDLKGGLEAMLRTGTSIYNLPTYHRFYMENLDMEEMDAEAIPLDIGGFTGAGWLVGKVLALAQLAAIAYVSLKGHPEAAAALVGLNGASWLYEKLKK